MYIMWFFLSLYLSQTYSAVIASEDEFVSKISSLMTIGDHDGARKVAMLTKELYPQSKRVNSLYTRCLANDGYLKESLACLPMIKLDADIQEYFSVLESIAWSFLLCEEGISSVSNIASLIGAYKTHDARCVHLLLKKLDSSNAYDRHLAVKMSMGYQDYPLKKKIISMAVSEKNFFVRLVLFEAIGVMKIAEGRGMLKSILSSDNPNYQEEAVILKSLISLSEKPNLSELLALKNSPKTSLREFSIGLITHFKMKEHQDLLISFLDDRHPAIRSKALLSLVLLETEKKTLRSLEKKIYNLVSVDIIEVSEIAKIVLTLINEEKGFEAIRGSLLSDDKSRSRFASRIIGYLGDRANTLMQEIYKEAKDPIVKANISFSMIRRGVDQFLAAKYLCSFLKEYDNKLMVKNEYSPLFVGVDESHVRHIPYIPNYPTLVDAMTRLELLSKIAIIDIDSVHDTMIHFLKNKMTKVSSAAAVMMLEESKLDDIKILRRILKNKDPVIRLNAALTLAFYGKDNSVSPVLEDAYSSVDWEKKVMILEAIGIIGNRSSIPFVIEVMKKESFILQKMAAATLLQCLYH